MQTSNRNSFQISDLVAWLLLLMGIGLILADGLRPHPPPLDQSPSPGAGAAVIEPVAPSPTFTPATRPQPAVWPTPSPAADEADLKTRAFLNSHISPDIGLINVASETDDAIPDKNWGQPLYYFPYPAGQVKITRGGGGHYNGYGPAYDFAVGADAPVLAARSGTVVKADYSHYDPDCTAEEAVNEVVIDHGDGTYGVYLHFAYSRPVLTAGDQVEVGDILGYTGCTGQANGPQFENPAHDFPNRIIYQRTGDQLEARIEGTRDGTPRIIAFPMTRTSCDDGE